MQPSKKSIIRVSMFAFVLVTTSTSTWSADPRSSLIDEAFSQYQASHQATRTVTKQQALITKTTHYITTTKHTAIKTALTHLLDLLTDWVPTSITPEVSAETGFLADDPLTYEAKDKTILAGEESPIIGKLVYNASNEALLIDSITIENITTASLGEVIDTIFVYDSLGKRIMTIPVNTDPVTLHGLNRKIPQGESTFWLTVHSKAIGKEASHQEQPTLQIKRTVTDMISSTTHEKITSAVTHLSDMITISPVLFDAVAFVSSAGGSKVATVLTENNTVIGILAFTTPARTNRWISSNKSTNLVFHEIQLAINDGTIAQTINNSITIRRSGTTMTPIAGVISGDTIYFPIADAKQKPATTTYRIIETTPDLSNNQPESVQVVLGLLSEGAVRISSDEPGSPELGQLTFDEDTRESLPLYD